MVATLLTGLGGAFGLFGGNSLGGQLAGMQAAGIAQLDQTSQFYQQDTALQMQLSQQLNDASRASLMSNANSGMFTLKQNAQASTLDANLKAANKWMSILGGS